MKNWQSINAFAPNSEDEAEMKHIKTNKVYAYRAWLPESIIPVGDTWIYFNSIEDFGSEEQWLKDSIKKHYYFVYDVQSGDKAWKTAMEVK